jgi:iron complex outermembrane recepter protein
MAFQRKKVASALACLFGVGGALVVALPALAADVTVQVTGSNIRRVDTETPSPVQIITREEIDRSGLSTIADVIRVLPVNNNGTIAESFTNGFAAGSSGVSMRGLGVGSTLVLLNGRRLAPYGLADDGQRTFVDLNQIPFDAVERVEILKDGASAIYGSDAIAGVINIILKQEYTGASANAEIGSSHKGDGTTYRLAGSWGFGELSKQKFNVFVSGDYYKQTRINMTDRGGFIGSSQLDFLGMDQRGGDPSNVDRLSTNNPLGIVRSVNPATGGSAGTYTQLGNRAACEAVGGEWLPARMTDPVQSTITPAGSFFCNWEVKKWREIQPETQKMNLLAKGVYQFNPDLTAYAEFTFSNAQVETRGTPTAIRSQYVGGNLRPVDTTLFFLPVGHPDNPFSAQGRGARLYYSAFDLGDRGRGGDYDSSTYRILAGLKGSNAGWDWDVGALYAKTETDIDRYGFYSLTNLTEAVNGRGGFGYYRVGASAGLNNPGVYGYVAPTLSYSSNTNITSVDAKATREFMKLAGGPLALAVGAEWRREEIDAPPTPGTERGDIIGLGYSAATGTRDVSAVYAELNAPVLKQLELNAAVRYDHYSDYGNSTTPKLGVRWTPFKELLVRGTYAQGFRAPNAYENGNSATTAFTTYVDPLRCPITGAALDCGSGQLAAVTSGNKDIKPEKSDSYTLGAVWEPMRGLSLGVDYWNFEVKDQITASIPQSVINNPAGFPNAVINRSTQDVLAGIPNSGSILSVYAPYMNGVTTKTDGIDIDARYQWTTQDWGRFTASVNWTHMLSFKRTLPDGTTQEFAGMHGPTELSSSAGTPQDRGVFGLGWDRGPWTANVWVRYVGPMDDKEAKEDEGCLHEGIQLGCSVASFTTVDLTASYKGFKNWEIYGGVNNLFNRKPPFDYQAGYGLPFYNFNYAQSGAIGTYFTLGARYTFK